MEQYLITTFPCALIIRHIVNIMPTERMNKITAWQLMAIQHLPFVSVAAIISNGIHQ